MKTILKYAALLSIISISLTICAKDDTSDGLSFATAEISPGIYMISGVGGFTGGNIGLFVGDDGVVMIDDSMPPLVGRMKSAIKNITQKPVDYLINTHVHGDHTGNNVTIGNDGTRIIAHDNLRINMLTKGLKTKDGSKPMPKAALPVITFSESMTFHLNGEDAKVFHVKNAHTDGDLVIYFEKANVIHTGDTLFNGMYPYIDFDNGGSIDGYIAAQKKILSIANDKTKIIPGHGTLSDKKQLTASMKMLSEARDLVKKLIEKGQTEEQIIAANPLAKFDKKWAWFFISTKTMTQQIYKGLTK